MSDDESKKLKRASQISALVGVLLVLVAVIAVDGVQDPELKQVLLQAGLGAIGIGAAGSVLKR